VVIDWSARLKVLMLRGMHPLQEAERQMKQLS
jgi:hypothetical protein